MNFDKFMEGLKAAGLASLKEMGNRSTRMASDVVELITSMGPDLEELYNTAVRTGEDTHWDSLRVAAGRVLLRSAKNFDTISSDARQEIKEAVFAGIAMASKLALA